MSFRSLVRALAIVLIATILSDLLGAAPASAPDYAATPFVPSAPTPVTTLPTLPAEAAPAPSSTPAPSPTTPALTRDQKIGQLLLVGLNGTELNRETWFQITNLSVGGVLLRSRNVVDAAQVTQLAASLQRAAAERGLPPLFIAADQEGGDVARLREGVTRFPSAMALGAARDTSLAYAVGHATAAELLPLGLNVNLAPVLDVLTDPDNTGIGTRAFGTDSSVVSEIGSAFLRGELDAGSLAAVKHYPGHGGAALDSHAGLPALDVLDTAPFDAAIAASAPVVMVGHLWIKSLDAQPLPASLSPNVLSALRAKFGGVILTDSLNMGAVTSFHSVPQAAVRALQAGADWLIISEPADVPNVVAAIQEAVDDGSLPEARLDEAFRRVWTLKSRLPSTTALPPDSAVRNAALAGEVARRSIALAQPDTARLPLSPSASRVLLLAPNSLAPADSGDDHYTYLAQLIAQRGPRVIELLYDLDDPSRNADYAAQAALYANISEVVLFGAWDAASRRDTLQRDALQEVQRTGKPIIVIGLHLPFDLDYLSGMDTYLATFGPARPQMEALVGVLFGDFAPEGIIPEIAENQ